VRASLKAFLFANYFAWIVQVTLHGATEQMKLAKEFKNPSFWGLGGINPLCLSFGHVPKFIGIGNVSVNSTLFKTV
jgi:hypothetical protein